ncbi:arginine ABC transporter permease ArtM [Candidatus Fukatsuia anoeciicola]|uniref:arginine ABC transporter permease ArtM n=1 Tax=Candidatus Fukatsuia anoeciicola TaxID=2994492 RepID=UPI003464D06E
MFEYLLQIIKGLQINLTLTITSLLLGLLIAVLFTIILTIDLLRQRNEFYDINIQQDTYSMISFMSRSIIKIPLLALLVKIYITLFTGTPLLVQIFLIYYGSGQFPSIHEHPWLWNLLSQPWLCAMIALTLNSAAYSTQLFYGAVRAIPQGQWKSCIALGMTRTHSLRVLLPFALKQSLTSYSNEVILIFKSTSLVYTITLMEVMGYSQMIYGRTYDIMAFAAAGIIYLCINGLLVLLMRLIEQYVLVFRYYN